MDYTNRLFDDEPTNCPDDCTDCEAYPFCSNPQPMVEDVQCEEVYDEYGYSQ